MDFAESKLSSSDSFQNLTLINYLGVRKKLGHQENVDKTRQDAADATQGTDVCTSVPRLSQHEHNSFGQP